MWPAHAEPEDDIDFGRQLGELQLAVGGLPPYMLRVACGELPQDGAVVVIAEDRDIAEQGRERRKPAIDVQYPIAGPEQTIVATSTGSSKCATASSTNALGRRGPEARR